MDRAYYIIHRTYCHEDNILAIEDTIRDPDAIYESHDSDPPMDYRELYVKRSELASYANTGTPYTKVVVFSGGGTAEVITTYNAPNETGGTASDDDSQRGIIIMRDMNSNGITGFTLLHFAKNLRHINYQKYSSNYQKGFIRK